VDEQRQTIEEYVENGGNILCEMDQAPSAEECRFLGIEAQTQISEPLRASYLRLSEHDFLRRGLEETPLLPFAGTVCYAAPAGETEVWATLVPPFAPVEAVGAPPERASIPTPSTDLPLLIRHAKGKGCVVSFACPITSLITALKIKDHTVLVGNVLRRLLGRRLEIAMPMRRGIQVTDYIAPGRRLIHLVNGIGQRPLSENTPVPISLQVRIGKKRVRGVQRLIQGQMVPYAVDPKTETLHIDAGTVTTWDVIQIDEEA